ncbi:MAG: flagellar biosynthetic protein FliR [Syntrophobacteraceae bacterium]
MAIFQFNPTEIGIFLAVLLRLSLCFFMIPLFSNAHLPAMVKAFTSLGLAVLLYALVRDVVSPLPADLAPLIWILVGEILLGLVLSLSVLLLFSSFQLAGELISFQMGFGFALAADPQSGVTMMVLSRWFQITATLILFSLNGHHMILRAIVESFRTVPIGSFTANDAAFGKIMFLSAQLFVIGLKVAAPIMLAMLLIQVGLGLMAKFSPQVNLLATTAPLTIMMGFALLVLCAAIWGGAMEGYLMKLAPLLVNVAR